MKPIKGIEQDMQVPFEGWTYTLLKGETVLVDEKLFTFLEERFPLSFSFRPAVKKGQEIAEVKKEKTKVFFPTETSAQQLGKEDMAIGSIHTTPTFGGADATPPGGTIDGDGVEWYGPGIEIDDPKEE